MSWSNLSGSARVEGNEQSDSEGYDENKDYPDEPTSMPPPPSLFE
jgi:hypothetical protein